MVDFPASNPRRLPVRIYFPSECLYGRDSDNSQGTAKSSLPGAGHGVVVSVIMLWIVVSIGTMTVVLPARLLFTPYTAAFERG